MYIIILDWKSRMKLLGILIIMNSLIVTGYWVSGSHQHKIWVVSICGLAAFIGIIFTMHDRAIEITFSKIGTIKAAAEQATADANAIADLRSRIEAQSATVDLVAQKATETIDQLKFIARTNAKVTIADLMAANFGFKDGLNLKTRLELHDRIISSLKQIGVSQNDIEDVDSMWHKGVGVIYFRGIRCALEGRTNSNIINKNASPELLRSSKEFQKLLNFENWEAPSPDEIESFIEAKGFMNDKVKELIEDYRYFLRTGDIRRRDVFEKL